jgi:hypothetical protein
MTMQRTSSAAYDKLNEHRRRFESLPTVLIQDPARVCAYCIGPDRLAAFATTPATWARLDDSTVTFVIPDGDVIDEVPSFLRVPELRPSVLIRYARGRVSFFLSNEELQSFRIEQPQASLGDDTISFIIPKGTELIEELPALRRALLQSNTQ